MEMVCVLSNQYHNLVLLNNRNTKGQSGSFFWQWGLIKEKKISINYKYLFSSKHILDSSSLSKEVGEKQELLFPYNNQTLKIRILQCNEHFLYRNIILKDAN